jgi:hypothetical protein
MQRWEAPRTEHRTWAYLGRAVGANRNAFRRQAERVETTRKTQGFFRTNTRPFPFGGCAAPRTGRDPLEVVVIELPLEGRPLVLPEPA